VSLRLDCEVTGMRRFHVKTGSLHTPSIIMHLCMAIIKEIRLSEYLRHSPIHSRFLKAYDYERDDNDAR
jgi:hypothetical protein